MYKRLTALIIGFLMTLLPVMAQVGYPGSIISGFPQTGGSGGGGSGTVTSVAHSATGLPFLTLSGSAITTSGTLTYTAACAVGDLIYGSASNVFSLLTGNGTATKNFLTMTSGIPAWGTIASGDLPTIVSLGTVTSGVWHGTVVSEVYGGTNQSTYAAGDTLYATGSNTLGKLTGNSTATKKFMNMTSSTPAWSVLAGADLPNPSSSTLGGTQSAAAVSHQWINSISTSGVPALSQPDQADVTNAAKIGANSDITSLTATTRLSAAMDTATSGTYTFSATKGGVYLAGCTASQPMAYAAGNKLLYFVTNGNAVRSTCTAQGSDQFLVNGSAVTTLSLAPGQTTWMLASDQGSFNYWVVIAQSQDWIRVNTSATTFTTVAGPGFLTCSNNSGCTVTLPQVTTSTSYKYPTYIVNTGSGTDTINTSNSEIITGPVSAGTSISLPANSAVLLINSTTGWYVAGESTAIASVVRGGTGAATFTSHGVLIGAGTSPITATTAGTTGYVLTSNGASADPTFQAAAGGGIGGGGGQGARHISADIDDGAIPKVSSYSSLLIDAGHILNVASGTVIGCTGTVDIEGRLSLNSGINGGKGGSGALGTVGQSGAGEQGGAGGVIVNQGGGGGSAASAAGGDAGATHGGIITNSSGGETKGTGSGGGGSSDGVAGHTGGDGGKSGGIVHIVSQGTVTFGSSGVGGIGFNASNSTGGAATTGGGGGGGGAGAFMLIESYTKIENLLSGGSRGLLFSGTDGGAGAGAAGGGGGGGAAGGYIWQAPVITHGNTEQNGGAGGSGAGTGVNGSAGSSGGIAIEIVEYPNPYRSSMLQEHFDWLPRTSHGAATRMKGWQVASLLASTDEEMISLLAERNIEFASPVVRLDKWRREDAA